MAKKKSVKKLTPAKIPTAKKKTSSAKAGTKKPSIMQRRPGMRYINHIPKKIPPGKILCHNGVVPDPITPNGFRFFLNDPSDDFVVCKCGWAPELPEHFIS